VETCLVRFLMTLERGRQKSAEGSAWRPQLTRRVAVVTLALIFACAALVPSIRTSVLSSIGGFLILNDPIGPADVLVMTPESNLSGGLEIADLYHEGLAKRVLILEAAPTSVDSELDRRGVHLPDLTLDTLVQLGVPRAVLTKADAGEGGTTENTLALATWARQHQVQRAIVVVSPTHGRRYRRALRRVWPSELSTPIIRTSRYDPFRASDWWLSRRTLREGLVEFEKLGLDYLAHPL